MREARGGILRVADGDLLEILDAPQIAVLAHRAEIEAGDAERLGADLGVPAIEPPEIEIGRAVRQPPGLDRVEVVDQEQEHVAIGGIERRGVLGDVDARIVDAGRPVEHARHLPAGVAGAVAGDALHGRDQLMVEDAAIVRAGDGAQLDAAVLDLQRLDLLGAMRGQAVLQIDAGERRRQLAQIGRRRADQAGELAEAPVRRRHRRLRARQHQAPGARHRRGWPRPGSPRSPPCASGCARCGRARRRTAPTATGSARPPAARTIPTTRGRSARRGSHPPCSRSAPRAQPPEPPPGPWHISMTGAGSLSPDPQPGRCAKRSPLNSSGKRRKIAPSWKLQLPELRGVREPLPATRCRRRARNETGEAGPGDLRNTMISRTR